MTYQNIFIFTSTEDDRYLVKGGIATYLGTLLPEAAHHQKETLFIWVTQSPNESTFPEIEGNCERHYVSRILNGERLAIEVYANILEDFVESKLKDLLSHYPQAKIYLESPDWEGLCANLFERFSHPSVLKVTRCHGPMANCFRDNYLVRNDSNVAQHHREQKQVRNSELVSCPSQFIFNRLESDVLEGQTCPAPHVIFGNCVETRLFRPKLSTKEEALALLSRQYGINIPADAKTIFAVGSLEPRKGTLLIADALNSILENYPELHFCFIGLYNVEQSQSIASNSIKLSKSEVLIRVSEQYHSRLHFSGVVAHHELPVVVHGADLHLICYLADNFPGSLNEVALSELPLVAAYRGGIPDMITKEGQALAYVIDEPTSAQMSVALFKRIKQHFDNPAQGKKFAQELRKHILANFSPDIIIEKYYFYYEKYLNLKKAVKNEHE